MSGRFLRLPFGGFGAAFDALAPCGCSCVLSAGADAVALAVVAPVVVVAVAFTAFLPESAAAIAFGLPNSKRPTSGPNFFTSFW